MKDIDESHERRSYRLRSRTTGRPLCRRQRTPSGLAFPAREDPEYSFAPFYKTVPQAALQDPYLYEVLALVDAIRDGRSRERQIAEEELKARLHSPRYDELQR
jgi:hypothetical protein